MKIALVIKEYALHRGGAERHAVHLSRSLARKGHEVHIVANRFEPRSSVPNGNGQVSTSDGRIRWRPVAMHRKPSWLKVLSFAANVRKFLQGERFDIVYGLTQTYPQDIHRMGDGIYRHWLRTRFPSPFSRGLHCALRPVHLANLYLEKRIYRPGNYRAVVANSRLFKQMVQDYYGVPAERIKVVYNGVDHKAFHPERIKSFRSKFRRELGISPETPVVLFVANDWRRKGLAALLKAMSLSGREGARHHLLVVGRGNIGAFRSLCRKWGVDERVTFAGATCAVQKFYGVGDLFVLPTLFDPFANVCLEAMACGLPVVTTAANGASELVSEGVNGMVVNEARDVQGLAKALMNLGDMEMLRAMGEAARDTALQYTWEDNVRQNLRICRRILQGKQQA